jgi:bifunctional non-homologous end joining protein LigD
VQEFEVGRHKLRLSNLEKVLYPATGFRKQDVLQYYARIAPVILPHMRDRPLTLKRYPNGVEGEFFYQKTCPPNRPSWLQTTDVWSEGRNDNIRYCMGNDLESLVWLANTGNLEIHTFLHRRQDVFRPDMVVFDLDPGPPANVIQCCEVALLVRDHVKSMGLQSFVKVSGSKGMQLYIPLHTPVTYDETKPFAHKLSVDLEMEHRKLIVSKMRKDLRVGKVLIDWSQNDDHKTTVCVYSLRAKREPYVSTPVTWKEVEEGVDHRKPERLFFTTDQALERVDRLGDLFAPVLKLKQKLPA